MAKGSVAKAKVVEKLKEVYGNDYIGENANKHYIWCDDGGERIQIAISLTCPKNPISTVDMSGAFGDGIDFEATPVLAQSKFEPAEITDQEKENLEELMKRLGL